MTELVERPLNAESSLRPRLAPQRLDQTRKKIKMRRVLLAVIVLSAVILLGGVVHNAELSGPPDVATSNWIPLGESFGFVIVSAGKTTRPKQPAQLTLSGYFMVKRGDIWFRLIEEWPGKVVPLAQN